MQQTSIKNKRRDRGGAIVEVALMAPWIFFLFVGIFDFGFYAYAAICTQNAARAVALAAAQTTSATIDSCVVAMGEMRMLPNVLYSASPSLCSIITTAPAVTQAKPVNVCVASLTAAQTSPCGGTGVLANMSCGDCTPSPTATSILAVVTYQTVPLVPIPGLLTGQMTLSRGAEVRQTSP